MDTNVTIAGVISKLPHLCIPAMGTLRFGSNLFSKQVPCSISRNASVIPPVSKLSSSKGRFTVFLISSQVSVSHLSLYLLLWKSMLPAVVPFCFHIKLLFIFSYLDIFLFFTVAVLVHSVSKKHLWAGWHTGSVKKWRYSFWDALLRELGSCPGGRLVGKREGSVKAADGMGSILWMSQVLSPGALPDDAVGH